MWKVIDGSPEPGDFVSAGVALPQQALEDHAAPAIGEGLFRVWWWATLVYHLVNGVFIMVLGAIHIYISLPGKYESLYLIEIEQRVLSVAGWTLFAIGVAHIAVLVTTVYQSLARRRLSLQHLSRRLNTVHPGVSRFAMSVQRLRRDRPRFTTRILKLLLSDDGVFGINSKYFSVVFYMRQAIEIMLQSYQASQLSYSVERRWINHLVVTLVVINCAFAPVINRSMRHYGEGRRIALLTCDLVLDFAVMVAIPILVIAPPALDVDWARGSLNQAFIYDDVWLTNAISGARQVMISSDVDYIATVFPHASGLLTLSGIKGLVHRLSTVCTARSASSGSSASRLESESRRTRIFRRAFYTVAFAWATINVVCHSIAQTHELSVAASASCSLHVHSWFATNVTCSVVQINCHHQALQGTQDEIGLVLAEYERFTLTRLILSHCPALSIPAVVTEFPRLLCIEVFNSTLVKWSDEAIVTRVTNPRLNQLHFVVTDFVSFPNALFTSALPPNTGLLVYRSNLTDLGGLRADLFDGRVWPYFSIEYTNVSVLPSTLSQLFRGVRLSLVGNKLTSVPEELFDQELQSLRLSGNAITSLPLAIGDTFSLYQLLAQDTNIEVLPPWLERWGTTRQSSALPVHVSLRGSPVCDDPSLAALCQEVAVESAGDYRYDVVLPHRQW